MKWYRFSFLMLGLAVLLAASACSKDDDSTPDNEPDGGGGSNEERIFMCAVIDGQGWTADTVNVNINGRAMNIDGKPYNAFIPGVSLTIRPGKPVGTYDIGVTGEIENASYTNGSAQVFLGQTGQIEIIEHRVDEYIKGKFFFTAKHSLGTLPDVMITEGEFESFY